MYPVIPDELFFCSKANVNQVFLNKCLNGEQGKEYIYSFIFAIVESLEPMEDFAGGWKRFQKVENSVLQGKTQSLQ